MDNRYFASDFSGGKKKSSKTQEIFEETILNEQQQVITDLLQYSRT